MNAILNYLGIIHLRRHENIYKLSILIYDFYEINIDIRENWFKNLFNNRYNDEIVLFG